MKVKVILECEVGGTLRAPGDVVEHPEELLAQLISEGKVEVVPEAAATETAPAAPVEAAPVETAPPAQEAAAPRVVTEADLAANPILVELAAAVGDAVSIGKAAQ